MTSPPRDPQSPPPARQEPPGLPSEPVDPPVIQAIELSKRFEIYLNDRSRLFEFLGRRKHHQEHWALQDLNFEVARGRSFGIVGANGAGKSTLLKLIAGISRPTKGTIDVRARLSTLLDLGLGFHGNFTGRENISLNCSLLGMSADQAEDRIPHIIAFAELAEFMDYPVRTYSSGMLLRLGFAIAAHTEAEVFLVDEVLAVGDQYFQRKCVRKIEEFVDQGRTIILVSHDLHSVRSLCQEAMWLDGGRVQAIGPAREVVDRYLGQQRVRISRFQAGDQDMSFQAPPLSSEPPSSETLHPPRSRLADDPALKKAILEACSLPEAHARWAEATSTQPFDNYDGDKPVVIGSGEVRVLDVQLLDALGRPRQRFRTGDTLVAAVTFRTTEPVERPIFGVAFFRDDGVYVYGPNTRFDRVLDGVYHGIYTFYLVYPKLALLDGNYRVSVAVFDKAHLKPHVWHNQLYGFEVIQDIEDHGLVRLEHEWGLIRHFEASGDTTTPPETK